MNDEQCNSKQRGQKNKNEAGIEMHYWIPAWMTENTKI